MEREEAGIRERWQSQLDDQRKLLFACGLSAYTKAAEAGITLRGDPLMSDASQRSPENQSPSEPSATEQLPSAPGTEQEPPPISIPPRQQPPSLTPSEVMHEQNLPSYQGDLIPKPLWKALVVLVGL